MGGSERCIRTRISIVNMKIIPCLAMQDNNHIIDTTDTFRVQLYRIYEML